MYPEFKPKTFIAPSGIESKTIVERTPLQNRDKIKVLTCANLKKRKNIDKVIEALKGLESFELTVIGDGDNRQKLEEIDSSVILRAEFLMRMYWQKCVRVIFSYFPVSVKPLVWFT